MAWALFIASMLHRLAFRFIFWLPIDMGPSMQIANRLLIFFLVHR